MALYFDATLNTPSGSVTVHAAWQKVSGCYAVCSASPNGGTGYVNLYKEDGKKKNKSETLVQRTYQPTWCAWHPARNLLAIGWENGEIVVWNDHNEELHQVPSLHNEAITTLQWSTNGGRLASGDKTGIAAVWRADERGRVQHNPVCRFEMGSEITQCVVPISSTNEAVMSKIASLARAAVGGDEKAMDSFLTFDEDKSSSSRLRYPTSVVDGHSFYFGATNGEIHYVNGKGHSTKCMTMESGIRKLLFYNVKEALVAISADLQVNLSRVHADGKTEELYSVKLSGEGTSSDVTWAGEGLLAAATSDLSLRLWDLGTDDNYTLSLNTSCGFEADEKIVSVAYSDQKRVLAAGTNKSRIAIWKFSPLLLKSSDEAEKRWHLQQATTLESQALHLDWCPRKSVLAVNCDSRVIFLTEHKMNWAVSDRLVAVQTAPKHVTVEISTEQQSQQINVSTLSPSHSASFLASSATPSSQKPIQAELETDILFTNLAVANEALAVWNGSHVLIYDVVNNTLVPAGNFVAESTVNALHDQSFFTAESGSGKELPKIEVRNFKGTIKQVLQFQEKEGNVVVLNVCGNYLVAATNIGFIRVYDLNRRDAKPHCNAKNMAEAIPYFGSFFDVKCNCAGTKVAMLIKQDNQVISPKLYVFDTEKDKIDEYDFASGQSSTGLVQSAEIDESRKQFALEVAGRYPISVFYDTEEPSLLVCEAQLSDQARIPAVRETMSSTSIHSITPELPVEQLIVLLYSTQDGILIQDSVEKTTDQAALIGLRVPNFYFAKTVITKVDDARSGENGEKSVVKPFSKITMHDFVGLENSDPTTRRAMLDFSFNLAMGNMDEAFKAIKLIKSNAVWESMAKMCVKTRRVDVARVCLGRMGHVRGAHALRLAEKEPELDARIAMLALQLGMNDEAERLYKKCQRFDLLNQFYQATGKWAKAIEVAEQLDRVHLRSTFHNYAKQMEAEFDTKNASVMYERAGTHTFEVPRMLLEDYEALESYIHSSQNPAFLRWWAQYLESQSEMDVALKYYEQAGDVLSLVRVYCFMGKVDKAAAIANETKNRAACYHLARHYENTDDFKQAIHFYTCAATYGNAIRICKEHGFEDQLLNLALLGSPTDMVEAATYYETRPDLVEKAVLLYHKAGHFSKALKLAFDTQQFAALESIAQDLDERADPILLERCANFFLEHEQYDKAVSLLVIAKKYPEAVDLCLENNVKLDESLVERLTPGKDETPSSGTREQLLLKLGDCCMKQGVYHLACKKYTQAGDREKAMRALLKSGDTEKIIFFAGVSRSRTIYVMAANYLQSLDWRKDPEIMKHIINYYTKGRALDSLAGFYDACAQVEIDEYQNYDKAVGALTEAFKCLSKAKMTNKEQQEDKVTELKTRIALVKKFIQAKRILDSDPEEAIKQCHVLLAEKELDSAVRIGDVYGLLIEHHAQAQAYDKAYQGMQEMQARIPTVNMAYYVNMRTIENIHRALGVAQPHSAVNGKRTGLTPDSDDDDIDKADISEEIYDNGDSAVDMYKFR